MGTQCHQVVAVVSWNATVIERTRAKAVELFGPSLVTEVLSAPLNCFQAFFVGPSGSKVGWQPYEEHRGLVAKFVAYFRAQAYEDGSNALDWAVTTMHEDDGVSVEGST